MDQAPGKAVSGNIEKIRLACLTNYEDEVGLGTGFLEVEVTRTSESSTKSKIVFSILDADVRLRVSCGVTSRFSHRKTGRRFQRQRVRVRNTVPTRS